MKVNHKKNSCNDLRESLTSTRLLLDDLPDDLYKKDLMGEYNIFVLKLSSCDKVDVNTRRGIISFILKCYELYTDNIKYNNSLLDLEEYPQEDSEYLELISSLGEFPPNLKRLLSLPLDKIRIEIDNIKKELSKYNLDDISGIINKLESYLDKNKEKLTEPQKKNLHNLQLKLAYILYFLVDKNIKIKSLNLKLYNLPLEHPKFQDYFSKKLSGTKIDIEEHSNIMGLISILLLNHQLHKKIIKHIQEKYKELFTNSTFIEELRECYYDPTKLESFNKTYLYKVRKLMELFTILPEIERESDEANNVVVLLQDSFMNSIKKVQFMQANVTNLLSFMEGKTGIDYLGQLNKVLQLVDEGREIIREAKYLKYKKKYLQLKNIAKNKI